jgi:hypothetical protein
MRIKRTLVSKGIHEFRINESLVSTYLPKAGDLAMFEVIELGRHKSAQTDDKRNASIFPGDILLATFADRYATSQYEGYVPTEHHEFYQIIGAGGVIGIVASQNADLDDYEPTKVKLLGYCVDQLGHVINTKFYQKKRLPFTGVVPGNMKIILSIGSTMDSGKTTTAAFTARGLKTTGKKVGFIKFTGTAYSKDRDFVFDCGADVVSDFAECGFPSTYMCSEADLLDVYQCLLQQMADEQVEYLVMEIADGLFQRETNMLLKHHVFMSTIHSVIFSCGDSLSALQGIKTLEDLGIKPSLISGRFTMSPLLIREVQQLVDMPVLTIDEIMTGEFNNIILARLEWTAQHE